MDEIIYRRLSEYLDRLPDGFPPSSTGADLRLLEMLFEPAEAELAVHLTLEREEAAVIAARAGLPADDVERLLNRMAAKGLIMSIQPEDGPALYHALPWVVGIYEFQVNNLHPALRQAMHDYWSTTVHKPRPPSIRQMRTIPIGRSLDARLQVLPHEHVGALVDAHTRFAVGPCICRRHTKLEGGGCDAPEDSCLAFGDFADYMIRIGISHEVTREEMLETLARADAANLVLQPSNSKDGTFICCCCGCCCGVLHGLQRQPKPSEAVENAFITRLDADLCQGCWICLERCQMGTLFEDGDRVALNSDRCIGCGLCVSTCPSGALMLVRKPGYEERLIPETMDETWRVIARDQAVEK